MSQFDELLEALLAVADRTSARMERTLAELSLTAPLSQALFAIDPEQPPPAMKTLAERLRCDRSSVTFLADRLTERGLAERVPGARDRRSKALQLTPEGVRVRTAMLYGLAEASPLAKLDQADQEALLVLLRKALAAD
ncbi:MarR family transcriptional regulator [Saccharothrix sp. AJ9571]|nr:MarR family transcriptional regulator [Saccharothrix sp. AJ9571]